MKYLKLEVAICLGMISTLKVLSLWVEISLEIFDVRVETINVGPRPGIILEISNKHLAFRSRTKEAHTLKYSLTTRYSIFLEWYPLKTLLSIWTPKSYVRLIILAPNVQFPLKYEYVELGERLI